MTEREQQRIARAVTPAKIADEAIGLFLVRLEERRREAVHDDGGIAAARLDAVEELVRELKPKPPRRPHPLGLIQAAGFETRIEQRRLAVGALEPAIGFEDWGHEQRLDFIRRNARPKYQLQGYAISGRGGMTLVHVHRPTTLEYLVAVGESICSLLDPFVARVGLIKAAGRALSELQRMGAIAPPARGG